MRATALMTSIVILGGAGAAVAQGAPGAGNPRAGQQLALYTHTCDSCHTVVANQSRQGMPLEGYGPSFFDIANRRNTTAQSLTAFLSHPHPYGRMPLPDLTPTQIADVGAYILSLRRRR